MKIKNNRFILSLSILVLLLVNFPVAAAQTLTPQPKETAAASSIPAIHEGFSIVPATGQATSRNFTFELSSGKSATAKAFIKNFSSQETHFYLYGSDPTVSNTGSAAYETRDMSSTGPGSWIQFDSPEMDLGPEEEKIVSFTVTVPAGTPDGEYRAGVTMEKTNPSASNPGITIATRVVSQAKIIVGAPAANTATVSTSSGQEPAAVPWQAYYFWISLALFLASLALLIWSIFHRGRHEQGHKSRSGKKKRHGHKK